MYKKLDPSVVTIYTVETVVSNGIVAQSEALGSGVFFDKSGLILTAAHVVQSAEIIAVKTYDGQVIQAEVVSSFSSADVALIKLLSLPKNIPAAKLGDSDALLIGEQVLVIGAPHGLEHSLSVGHVSGKQKKGMILSGELMEFIQTDAAINQGNSGGPIFNSKGEVVGIVSSILTQSGGFEGIGFAASINPTKRILLEGSPFWTGFEGFFLQDKIAATFNIPSGSGMLIERVVSNSFAAKAGLKGGVFKANIFGRELWLGGDIIVSILNTNCSSPHDFEDIKTKIEKLNKGEPIVMEILRAGKIIQLKVKTD